MKKSWGLTQKILTGQKTVESRWYKNKSTPWNKVKPGDIIWFKDSGCPVTLKTKVTRVLQFNNLTSSKTQKILQHYSQKDLGLTDKIPAEIMNYFKNKNYCILVFFHNIQKIKPFHIDKTGFGSQAAWITINNIKSIKKTEKITSTILLNSWEQVISN